MIDQIRASDLVSIYEFMLAILQIGYSKTEYQELLDSLTGIWDIKRSPDCFDWGLDTLDALINYSCPYIQLRENFFSAIVGAFSYYLRRIHPDQWNLFKELCEDLNHKEIYQDLKGSAGSSDETLSDAVVSHGHLEGKLIAIYTLEDPVAVRVKAILEKNFTGVEVKTDNSLVANERLAAIAREADIFIFAWRSAKHPAFHCIEDNRFKDQVTLKPLGKGSSSMLRSLYDYIEKSIN